MIGEITKSGLQRPHHFEMIAAMARIGAKDVFEKDYTDHFRSIVKGRGEFVQYERDRALRDIGVHFTKTRPDGGHNVTTALAWFQLKGIMAKTMSSDAFRMKTSVPCRLKVAHLRFWYLLPEPTYLALYIESAGEPPQQQGSTQHGRFLILNLRKYVEDRWGRSIFDVKEKWAKIEVPVTSVLDDHALDLIVRENDRDAWSRALGVEPLIAKQCLRDHQLIWRLATALERNVEHRVQYRPWMSKRRTTLDFEERTIGTTEWLCVRSHWAQSFSWPNVETSYPFIDFFTNTPPPDFIEKDEDPDDDDAGDCDNDVVEALRLKNGDKAEGFDISGEYEQFTIRVALNTLGRKLFQHVRELVRLGFVSVDPLRGEFLSAAPWDDRNV